MKLQFGSPDWSLRPLPHSAPPNRGGCCLQPPWPSRLASNRPMNLPGMCLPPDCMLTAACKHKLSDRMLQRGRCEPCSNVDWTGSMHQCGCCQIMQGLGQCPPSECNIPNTSCQVEIHRHMYDACGAGSSNLLCQVIQ